MNKLERWTRTINEYVDTHGEGYLCWCPINKGETLRSCKLYQIGIDINRHYMRLRLYFIPEGAKDEPKQDRLFIFDFRPALYLSCTLIETRRDKMREAEYIAHTETGKFFRINGLQPIEGVAELVEAITARFYFLNRF